MTMAPNPPGGHEFGASLGGAVKPPSASPSPHRPRRRLTGLVLAGAGVVVFGAVVAGAHWGANVAYDDALTAFDETVGAAEAEQTRLGDAAASLAETTAAAATIADAETGTLMDARAKDAFTTAVDQAMDAASEATALTEQNLPRAEGKPEWTWELFAEAAQLGADRDAAAAQLERFDSASADTASAAELVDETGAAAVLSAADAAETFEAAHVSARNRDIIALRHAADGLRGAAVLDATTADAYIDLESAAAAMLASEQAELSEKQGPLFDARVQIEAFARELAPDVLIDFDWSDYVGGYGEGDSMGGYATWWYGDPGYSTIELSNSVAALWPSERSRALVAHEVGHAISVKCEGMYDDTTQESIEAWATAWAISMGFTDAANGTSAYGTPPQALIDAAAGCR